MPRRLRIAVAPTTASAGLAATALLVSLLLAEDSRAQDQRFAGVWRIASATTAPWAEADATPDLAAAEAFIGERVTFQPDRVEAPAPLGCGGATYAVAMAPPQGLFQGSLPEASAAEDAAALGVIGEAPTLQVSCDTGAFDYHLVGAHLLTGLDNVIYTLERDGN